VVGFFSLEMSSEQLANRILSAESQIKSHELLAGKLDEIECRRFLEVAAERDSIPLYIKDEAGRKAALALQEAHQEESPAENMGAMLSSWLDTPLPLSVFQGTALHESLLPEDEPFVIPCVVCAGRAYCGASGMEQSAYVRDRALSTQVVIAFSNFVEGWFRDDLKRRFPAPWGGPLPTYIRHDATAEERELGYRFVTKTEPEDLI